tara:strand:+ start:4418 stop:5413 length:996 start_codon:yes stop_codon:yes gene_type:complete
MKNILLVGGSGFVGYHITDYFISKKLAEKVFIFDIVEPINDQTNKLHIGENKLIFKKIDVRKPLPKSKIKYDLIINLAAVHREPGHMPNEYYETNIKGSENVKNFALENECENLIFFSSISAYGPTENKKDEYSLTMPETPYGISKLISENIHKTWAHEKNKLLIVRPGVIYGKYEKGNVTRMIKAIKNRYFFYTGNQKIFKSGIYIKEICNFLDWYLFTNFTKDNITIANLTMKPIPRLENYVDSICSALNRRSSILNLPHFLLQLFSHIINIPFVFTKKKNPFDPVRVKKLKYSNTIYPTKLSEMGYVEKYNIDSSFEHWKNDDEKLWK